MVEDDDDYGGDDNDDEDTATLHSTTAGRPIPGVSISFILLRFVSLLARVRLVIFLLS